MDCAYSTHAGDKEWGQNFATETFREPVIWNNKTAIKYKVKWANNYEEKERGEKLFIVKTEVNS
jgi:hypothetical protein